MTKTSDLFSFRVLFLLSMLLGSATFAQESSDELFEKGFEAYDEGDYLQAIELYTSAISKDQTNPSYYYHRGVCFSSITENEKAIKDFDQAIALQADYGDAYFERAYSYYVLEDNALAIENYDKAIELLPDYGPAYLNRGSVKFDMDDLSGACLDWKKAVILDVEIAQELVNEYCPSKT